MSDRPSFSHRIGELAAGRPLPEIVSPPEREPAAPRLSPERITIGGVVRAPAERLAALSALAAGKRLAARSAYDQMRSTADAIRDREQQLGMLRRGPEHLAGTAARSQIAQLEVEIHELRSARADAEADAGELAAEADQAARLFDAARKFCLANAIPLPAGVEAK